MDQAVTLGDEVAANNGRRWARSVTGYTNATAGAEPHAVVRIDARVGVLWPYESAVKPLWVSLRRLPRFRSGRSAGVSNTV